MRISDLLEQQEAKTLPVITTKRFDKEFQSVPHDLKAKFEKWLHLKMQTPSRQLGKADKPGQYGLNPWNHLHLKYGKVLVHYLALPDLIILAAITDHGSVEGGTQELENMVSYLHGIDVAHMRTQAQQVIHAHVPQLSASERSEAMDLMYWLAADPQERLHLIQVSQTGHIDPIEAWLHTSGLPVHEQAVATYVHMAQQALRDIQPS